MLVNNAAIYPSKEVSGVHHRGMAGGAAGQRGRRVRLRPGGAARDAAAGSGRIINVSSITFFGGTPFLAPYVTSKGALVGLTRALARECGEDGITVNAIAPGRVPHRRRGDPSGPPTPTTPYVLDQQAVKRRGEPADVANAVLFLAAPESSFITGQLLCVDGGWVMH